MGVMCTGRVALASVIAHLEFHQSQAPQRDQLQVLHCTNHRLLTELLRREQSD